MDHVNNDGNTHRRLVTNGLNRGGSLEIYKWIIANDFPDDFQILCFNCNMGKHFLGQCPHVNADGKSSSDALFEEREDKERLSN